MSDPRTAPPPRAEAGPPPTAASFRPAGKPLQYSMRSLLIVVTLVAVIAAIVPYAGFSALLVIIGVIGLTFVAPVCIGTLALYSRGYRQTFFIGAFIGALSPFYIFSFLDWFGSDLLAVAAMFVVGAAATGACGFAAHITRRFLERRGWHLPLSRDD